jgi:hypothetical protein
MRGAALLLAAGLVVPQTGALAAPPHVEVSSDVTIVPPGGLLDDHGVRIDGCTTCPHSVDLGLAEADDVDALHAVAPGVTLFSLDTTRSFGALVAGPEDVVRYDANTTAYTLELDGSAAGVPAGVDVDAVAVFGGDLLLSFDTAVDLGTVVADDEDVVIRSGGSFFMFLDGSAVGVPAGLDLDGVHVLPNVTIWASFDGSGSLSGVPFDDEDVLELAGGVWSMGYDASAVAAGWAAADLDALTLAPDADLDDVLDVFDSCTYVSNAPVAPLAFQTTTGGQLDDDADGFGNQCDGDYNNAGAAVDSTDVGLFKAAFGKKRSTSLCNPGGSSPCDRYDHNNATAAIDSADFTVFKTLFGKTKKSDGDVMDRCPSCPLPCSGDACP